MTPLNHSEPPDEVKPESERKWWQYGYLWLVLSGPIAVVIASMITAWLVIKHPDPVLEEDYYQRGLNINKTLAGGHSAVPAMQGRNHVTTPKH